jgi:phosphoglycolate phosphatase
LLIIFDWDGTLCDSTGRITDAMRGAARELGLPIPPREAVRDVIGLGLPEALDTLFPEAPLERRQQMRERYSAHYVEIDRQPAGLFPGALETLEALRGSGHRLAVATGKGRHGLNRVLRGLALEQAFDATRCADETASKPSPRMLHELLREFELPPADAVMVGDSEYDLLMARAAGVPAIGVSYGVHPPRRLQRHGPRAIIDALPELPPLLDGAAAG